MLVLIVDDEIKTHMKKYNEEVEEVTIGGDDLEFQKLTVITDKNFKLCSMFVCI